MSSEELPNSDWIEERSQINSVMGDIVVGKPDEGQLL